MVADNVKAPVQKGKPLGRYRGKPETGTTAKITNTGDGLSEAMDLEPLVYEPGELVTFVIRTRAGFHRHDLDKDGKGFVLQQQFSAGTVAMIDDDLVADVLNEMESRVLERKQAEEGQPALDGMSAATGRRGRRSAGAADLRAIQGGGESSGDGGAGEPE